MKIRSLQLEKYGSYENRTIALRDDARLHLITGPNEAGKTTALSAIGDLLFGFNKSKVEFAFGFAAADLRLGGVLQTRDGKNIAFRRRRPRNKNSIIDADDKPLGDDFLDALLGNVSRQVFEEEFGLTAERLRKGGDTLLAANGSLAESLAAGSAGLGALSERRRALQGQADDIFTSRKVSSKAFYIAADAYSETVRQLREAIVTVDAVDAAQKRSDEAGHVRVRLEEEHKAIARDLARLQRAKRTRGRLLKIEDIKVKLAALVTLPDVALHTLESWQTAFAELKEKTARLSEADMELADIISSLDAQSGDPAIHAAADEIDGLREGFGAAEKARIDLPNREKERHATWLQLEKAARELGLSSPEAVIDAMPSQPVLARVNALVRERRDLDVRRQDLLESYEKAKRRQVELQNSPASGAHVSDPALLSRALDSFSSIPADAALLRQQEADLDQALVDLQRRANRLQPAAPLLEDLVHMGLPDSAIVESLRRELDAQAQAIKQLNGRIGDSHTEAGSIERRLGGLEAKGDIATRADLRARRAERDGVTAELVQALEGKAASQGTVLAGLRESNLKLDSVTDALLDDTERAATKLQLEQELSRVHDEMLRFQDQLAEARASQGALLDAWGELWSGTGIEPSKPDAMTLWLSSVKDIVERYDRLSGARVDIASQRDKLNGLEPGLLALLPKLNVVSGRGLPLEEIYNSARKALSNLQDEWTKRREHAVRMENSASAIKDVEARISDLDMTLAEKQAGWNAAMAVIGLASDTGTAEAGAALQIWSQAIADRDRYDGENYRVVTIREDLEKFQASLAELCARLAPELVGTESRPAVEALTEKLRASRRAMDETRRLGTARDALLTKIETMRRQRDAALSVLAQGTITFGLSDPADMEGVLDQLQKRHELATVLESSQEDLAVIAEGMEPDALLAEQAGLDFDAVDGEIERQSVRASQLIKDMNLAAVAEQNAQREFDALTAGRNASALAQQKQEAAAELLELSRRWLVRAGAARLATQAIERHRQSAQDPVIARASTLFAHATGGAFAGLGVQFGDDDQPVFKALRTKDAYVDINGLSEGTRDQLYLALRLALLERGAGEPWPFVGDDILISFDDQRTGQAIDMLAEFGQNRQVILFSHHSHVAEIARDRLGSDLDLIAL